MKFETYEDFLKDSREKYKEWYKANAEYKKEYQRKRYLEKREEILAKNKERYKQKKLNQLQELER